MKKKIVLSLMITAAATFAAPFVVSGNQEANPFTLKDSCPASFQKMDDGACEFRNLYQLYPSVQGRGMGMKTALPEIRDGFQAKQIDLGRYLFFDPILSGGHDMSCATCHDPDKGFSDGLDLSVGAKGNKIPRSAPTLWNVGFLPRLFWDARANSLEEQLLGPLYNDKEMANTEAQLIADINSVEAYRLLFAEAFERDPREDISLGEIYTALSGFEASLVSFNSRYDHYVHGHHDALTKKEIEGLNLFRSFVARCSECHTPPLFTSKETAVIVTPEHEGMPFDIGAEATYNDPTMRGAMKVPTLRNIEKTGPYMHSGFFKNLRDAANFYNEGRGHAVPEGEKVRIHWHIWEPNLKDNEIDRLVDFLKTLTDESLMPEIPKAVPSGLPLVSADSFQAKLQTTDTNQEGLNTAGTSPTPREGEENEHSR